MPVDGKRKAPFSGRMAFLTSFETRASEAILSWYDRCRRELPWRASPGEEADPYRVWLAEIMLQQTTVAAVKPYYAAFLSRWPDIGALAQADLVEILKAWAGLGYYARARHLHACAKIIVSDFDGRFPRTEAELRGLPGIGAYSAAAVAAIAFGERVAAIDGNATRVLARLFAINDPLPKAAPIIKLKAGALVPSHRPGDFAQALMDLGAMVCSPRQPSCALCPLSKLCLGHARSVVEALPRRGEPRPRRERHGAVFYIERGDRGVLIRNRPPYGLLGGMAELPSTRWDPAFDEAKALRDAPLRGRYHKLEPAVTHVFTHFRLTLFIFATRVGNSRRAPGGHRWVEFRDLGEEALPSLMRKVIVLARANGAPIREGCDA